MACMNKGSVDMNGYFDFKSSPGGPVGLVIKCSSFPGGCARGVRLPIEIIQTVGGEQTDCVVSRSSSTLL